MSFRERPGPAVLRLAAPASLGLLLGACTVGPDYQRPAAPVPVAYKEAAAKEGWQIARPADSFDRGAWWSVYTDPVLEGLERQIDISNQNLKSAEARFRQAEAIVAEARAGFFPTATINAQATRSRVSGNLGRGPGGPGSIANFFSTTGSGASNFSKSSKDSTLLGICRNTAAMPFFWLKKLARKREMFGIS